MAQITYANKSTMNSNSSIPATNKCQASDMNEIKSVVNANYNEFSTLLQYSTSEINTGKKWIDAKPIYRKVINFGSLPNTNTKSVSHGISNIDFILKLDIMAKDNTHKYYMPIPTSNPVNNIYSVSAYVDSSKINIQTGDNKTNYNICYAIVEYTKTTD